jgi:RecB family exonuclease
MHINFGLHLDGQRGWHPSNRLGHQTLGPLGFLTTLETQLGLLRDHPSQSERIVQYRDCLKRCDHPDRFYHRSFATDELGTAATLLGWRDLWHLHGWTGVLDQAASMRLRDMGQVEQLAVETVSPSLGERLALVLRAMQVRRPAIDEVVLADPLAAFPFRWREVLAQLPVQDESQLAAQGEGLLGELQTRLLRAHAGESTEPLAWRNDGSLTVVQAETCFLSGRWLAGQMADSARDTLMVAGSDAALFDGLLAANDKPRQGFREASAFRPTLQVLPLALELVWAPLNFYALLQFLSHSVSPIPGFARFKLAGVVADRPGMGGEAWREALAKIAEHYGDKAAQVSETIQHWVENPRYSQETGAPVSALLQRVRWLENFFRVRLADADRARRIAFNAGFAQARACAEALEGLLNQGVATLRPRQLQKLVTQATARGSENPLWITEVGACPAVSEPGAVVDAFDRVIWWQMGMPAMPSSYPWSQAEIVQLVAAGVHLPNKAEELEHAARAWLKPILAARKQVILVLPPKGCEVHPVWLMIEALVKGVPVRPLDTLLTLDEANTTPVVHTPLPPKRRWWSVPAGALPARKGRDSYSSLELLLFNPYHWVLKYPAALKTSRILALGQDFRLLGNLAHGLVERFFIMADALHLDDAAFAAWFGPAFEAIVAEEGATLLMPGRRSDLESFRLQLRSAMEQLRHQLRRAGVVKVAAEMELDGQFVGGELGGYADLVLTRADGAQAVVDMKWSGSKFADALKENRHLQLAIYAELLRQKNGAWPQVGYFVLNRGHLLMTDDHFFPDARLIKKTTEENTAQLWLRFIETWKWRRAQLDVGQIELTLEEIDATDASVFPETGLFAQVLNPDYNDYLALAGWED